MELYEIFIIAVGLSMDAFAVSITLGLSIRKPNISQVFIPGIYFGTFQALMPFIGYIAGTLFAAKIQSLDHWVAFGLLGIIGAKMIKDSYTKNEEKVNQNPFMFFKMFLLAIATSIDALAVGITFALFEIIILKTVIIIGLTNYFHNINMWNENRNYIWFKIQIESRIWRCGQM